MVGNKIKAIVQWDSYAGKWKVEVLIDNVASGRKWFDTKKEARDYAREKRSMKL